MKIEKCVVAGGGGAVGRLFAGALRGDGVEVDVVDPETEQGDVTDITPALAARLQGADLVLMAVPERVALSAAAPVAAAMRPGALLAQTLSVQEPFADAAAEISAPVEIAGLNPMFAPSLGFTARPIAAITLRGGPRTEDLLTRLDAWGSRVVRIGAREHDRFAAGAQALTHATVLSFGAALAELGADTDAARELGPPPYRTLLALLARVGSGTPEVYWDIQAANPHAAEARTALLQAVWSLAEVIEKSDEEQFAGLMATARSALGGDIDLHRDTCVHLFEKLGSL